MGCSTSFPAALTIAASFDVEMAFKYGDAMGKEFAMKGSNMQLGPGVNVARVPVNGRNFEYISGEDPFLGAAMVAQVVKGIQSHGVLANIKHYVLNNQETNRNSVSSIVDERTRWEIYYPPFESAVEAGVGKLSPSCAP
jgi:beta-glucosidase